jgi:pimeloyl-ACP methyl ester carboxylesterase
MLDARQVVLAPPEHNGASAVRSLFRILSSLSPPLAARAAERLWFTPPRPAPPPPARALLATGTRADVKVNGRRVAVWSWGEGRPVLLMHGWGGYGGQMGSYVGPLVSAGFRPITLDAPGHGISDGSISGWKQSTFFDFADALAEITRRDGDAAGLIAHSGGCTASSWAIRSGWRVERAVFVAPMASPLAYQAVFQRALGIPDDVLQRFSDRVQKRLGFQWSDMEVTALPQRTATPPLLVIHDREDPETPFRGGEAIAAAWPDATFLPTSGLGHRKVLRDPACVRAAVEFLSARR